MQVVLYFNHVNCKDACRWICKYLSELHPYLCQNHITLRWYYTM